MKAPYKTISARSLHITHRRTFPANSYHFISVSKSLVIPSTHMGFNVSLMKEGMTRCFQKMRSR